MTKLLITISFLFLVGISISNAEKVYAQKKPYGLECAFLEDNFKGALTNNITCTMSPDIVFSSKTYKNTNPLYCDQDEVFSVDQFKNFSVDFKKEIVSYTKTSELSESALIRMKRYYIDEGKSESEAEELINYKRSQDLTYDIDDLVLTKRTLYLDPITGKYNRKEKTTYNVHFDNSILHFTEGIPEAIITRFTGNAKNSWIRLRFGKCRVLQE